MMFERRSMLRVQALVLGALLAVAGAAQTAGMSACAHHHSDAASSPADAGHETHHAGMPGHGKGSGTPAPDQHSDDTCRLHCMLLGQSTPIESPGPSPSESILPVTVSGPDAPDEVDAPRPTQLRFFLPFSLAPPTSA